MGRPREHNEQTGESLLDAAEDLLRAGGPDAVSVRAVADAAGTSTRAVYSVFGSKEGMLHHLARRGYRYLADQVDALPVTDDPAGDLVRLGIHGFRRFALEKPHLFRLTFERVTPDVREDDVVLKAQRLAYDGLTLYLERARTAGLLDDDVIHEAAFQFHAVCHGLASNELLNEPPPIGSGFWQVLHDFDGPGLWRSTISALIAGWRSRNPEDALAVDEPTPM